MSDFADLIRALTSTNEELRIPNQQLYMQKEAENPVECMANLLSILNSDDFHDITTHCFIYLYRITSVISAQDNFEIIPPEIVDLLKTVLIKYIQLPVSQNSVAIRHAYLILQQFVIFFTTIQPAGEILEAVHSQIQTSNQALAITYICYYASIFTGTDNGEAIFQNLIALFLLESSSTETFAEQIHLYMQLLKLSPNVFEEDLMNRCASLFIQLINSPKPGDYAFATALRYFKDSLKMMSEEEISMCAPIIVRLFSVFSSETALDSQKLELIDNFVEITKFYGVTEIIIENLEEFGQRCIAFIQKCGESQSELIENINDLLTTLCEEDDFHEKLTELFTQYLESENLYIASSMLRILYPTGYILQLFELLKVEDRYIVENALVAIEAVLNHHFEKETELNEDNLLAIFKGLYEIISDEYYELALKAIATLLDGAVAFKLHDFIVSIAQDVLQILSSYFTVDSVHLAAAIAIACPSDMSDVAAQISTRLLESIENEEEHLDGLNILSLEGNFLRCMDDSMKLEFMDNLIRLTEKYPDIVTSEGFGFCIKAVGQNMTNFIDIVMPKLIENSSKDPAIACDFNISNSDSVMAFQIPGSAKNLVVRSEEIVEITNSIKNLAKFIKVVGRSVTDYNKELNTVVSKTLYQMLDKDIRIASIKLISVISVAFPETAAQYAAYIHSFLLGSEDDEDGCVAEPENVVRMKCLHKISKLIEKEAVPIEYVSAIADIPAQIINMCAKEIIGEINNNSFSDNVYREYLDTVWETLTIMKSIENRNHEIAIIAFQQCISALEDNNLSEHTPLFDIIRAGLLADFLEIVPEYEHFDSAFKQLTDGMMSTNENVRQLSLYGFGRAATKLDVKEDVLDGFLSILAGAISNEDTKEENYALGNECGLSSLCLILEKRITVTGTANGIEGYIQFLANNLPVYRDDDESEIVYRFLYNLRNNSRASQMVRDFCDQLLTSCENMDVSSDIVSKTIQKCQSA
ncbi:hypothetical protein TVAG_348040 [Trichomonas vaginalis G3]|uniref:Uncharacterized protein n=1 Tax=Trichomonas vaginalis (strain ATCC PRA-98 / G3) TaxID=412133 RepID=A2DSU5_TRIV3|nr:armadillo (ARM) repeat-containing protein family [Trichomonas vaginalis G3]EAY16494.1 hypothetical protein TVAG_348040 [Trichomonas vaginalis G3]KAI5488019.1 armadillo (ARM) repeat-containing protein family [Trichomonas vaginalis G3]|eukprot:XP_001328717.1 hypothetical protein [Trichomonas vaginalis G3]